MRTTTALLTSVLLAAPAASLADQPAEVEQLYEQTTRQSEDHLVVGRPRGRLVLWNTLGSKQEIHNSRVGPGGTYKGEGGRFAEGDFGGALLVNHNEHAMVSFPAEVISPQSGCIEVWAKMIGFSETLAWGENPAIIKTSSTGKTFGIHLNGNDGKAKGGLCGWAGSCGSAGTGRFGNWTYEQVFGKGKADQWHHYALVWDKDGLAGLAGGQMKVAVFLNGQLNSARWDASSDTDFSPLDSGELQLMTQHHLHQGSIAFDDLKVWNYAKTDFSDRYKQPSGGAGPAGGGIDRAVEAVPPPGRHPQRPRPLSRPRPDQPRRQRADRDPSVNPGHGGVYGAASSRTWLRSRGLTGRNCDGSSVATATVRPVSVMNSTSYPAASR